MSHIFHRAMFATSGATMLAGVLVDGFWVTVAFFTLSGLTWFVGASLENRP